MADYVVVHHTHRHLAAVPATNQRSIIVPVRKQNNRGQELGFDDSYTILLKSHISEAQFQAVLSEIHSSYGWKKWIKYEKTWQKYATIANIATLATMGFGLPFTFPVLVIGKLMNIYLGGV